MRKWKGEKGEMIVEATLVFPVVFFVIFFLIYFGNVFYVRSKVDAVTDIMAVKGASTYIDPMLESIQSTGSVPMKTNDIKPYRYWFKTSSVEGKIRSELSERLGGVGTGLFAGMEPASVTTKADYENHFFYDTFVVEVTYDIKFPIRFIGSNDPLLFQLHSKAIASAADTDEFVRNTDMVLDYYENTGMKDKVQEVIKKVKSFFGGNGGMKN